MIDHKKLLPRAPRLGKFPKLPRPRKLDDSHYQDVLKGVTRNQFERPKPAGLGAMFGLLILLFFFFVLPRAFFQ